VRYPGPDIRANEACICGWMESEPPGDLILGHSAVARFDAARLAGWSDWFVRARFEKGDASMEVSYGHGSPIVFATFRGGDPIVRFPSPPEVFHDAGGVLGVCRDHRCYLLVGPASSRWSGRAPRSRRRVRAFRGNRWSAISQSPPNPHAPALADAAAVCGGRSSTKAMSTSVALTGGSSMLITNRRASPGGMRAPTGSEILTASGRPAVLSNVTRDHLDFHETLDAYRAAKRRLFDMSQRCVLNHDDDSGAQWAAELAAQGRDVVTYGLQSGAMLQPRQTTFAAGGSRFTVDGRPFELRLPGRFNVSNALAAIAVARMHGIGDECSASALAALERVAGRMERIPGNGFDVVVDYAHTPDALANALGALRETTTGNVAVVFGCGGDRDRGKRPEMGAVAARLADRLYLTNDNPRTEEPSAILRDIRDGIRERNVPVIEEPDRRRAIERAISDARSGDVVLLAGKGHEDYQIIGECVHEFDDAKVARDALAHLPAR